MLRLSLATNSHCLAMVWIVPWLKTWRPTAIAASITSWTTRIHGTSAAKCKMPPNGCRTTIRHHASTNAMTTAETTAMTFSHLAGDAPARTAEMTARMIAETPANNAHPFQQQRLHPHHVVLQAIADMIAEGNVKMNASQNAEMEAEARKKVNANDANGNAKTPAKNLASLGQPCSLRS